MDNNQWANIFATQDYVRRMLNATDSSHDWWHIHRVLNTALHIGKEEKADLYVVQLGALLHDVADWKFHGGDETKGAKVTREWLTSLHVEESVISHVSDIVEHISFKGAGVKSEMKTLEGKVVQDADRLDAIGAIGIARTFAYGGHKNRDMYNPDAKPTLHKTFEQYKSSNGTTINHFYEKLLLLKDLMNTETGKRLAEEKHAYMEGFLKQFMREWNGMEGL